MNAAAVAIVVLGALSIILCIAVILLLREKSQAEKENSATILELRSKAEGASRLEGQVGELDRSLGKAQQGQGELQAKLDDANERIRALTEEVATAKSEAQSARENAEQQIQQAKDNAEELVRREKKSCDEVVALKETACSERIAQAEQGLAKVLDAKNAELAEKGRQIEELKSFVEKANETLGTQFKALSSETLKDVSEQFQKVASKIIEDNNEKTVQDIRLHKQQIENLLQPMGETLKKLDGQVKETNEKRGQAEAVLMSTIRQFAGSNEKLANALSKPVIRGSFAEVKLESLLEAAGLVRGENYDLQVPVKDGDQNRFVDALVYMANGKKMVIDSKNLLVPFVEYANAPDPEKEAKRADFQRALKNTLKDLSLKDYAKHFQGLDAVLMFLPDEGMYLAALDSERSLIASMYEHRVFVVSPVSLLPILKSVAYILGLERQNRDTLQIVESGRALYESLGIILLKVKAMGDKLEDSVKAYNGVVASFEGNVLPKSRTLASLGVTKGKGHPEISTVEPEIREFKQRVEAELGCQDGETLSLESRTDDGSEG